MFELQNPNFVTGILGAFAIILAFIGFGSLPLNIAGLLLIVLAIVLFVLELTVTSHGLLAIGGLVAFVLGASALYTEPGTPTAPSVEVARAHHRDHDHPRRAVRGRGPVRRHADPPDAAGERGRPRATGAPDLVGTGIGGASRTAADRDRLCCRARNGPHGARTAAAWSAARRCGSWARMAWC